ncbi:vacuolar protein sorting protein 18 [Trypanosoma cruzi]|nr:vacuolar protein sorting protein 18 [Trypanosoma cruzi]
MYVASEKVSWFDPALLTSEHVASDIDDSLEIKEVVMEVTRRRFEEQTLADCAQNSRSVHAAVRAFYCDAEKKGVATAIPSIGYRMERPACPIDHNVEPFAHVVVAGGIYAVVTEQVPQHLYFFDQEKDIAISRLKLASDAKTSDESPAAVKFFIDEKDAVSTLFLDPRGNFCVVRWRSGKAAYYHIPHRRCHRRHHSEGWPTEGMEAGGDEERSEEDMAPRRFPLQFSSNVTGMLQPFYLECVAWDPNNKSDTTTGDIILGSSSGGVLLACRLETHGIFEARKLYQFPQPYSTHPIDSVAYMVYSQSPEHTRHHVVFIAQNSRLFVFSSLWGQGGRLEAAFDTNLMNCKNVVPRSNSATLYPGLSLSCAGLSGGSLMNYISINKEASTKTMMTTTANITTATTTSAATPSPVLSSSSIGCRHRALSSTVAHVDTKVTHASPDASMPRLFSQVAILDPRELIPTKSSSLRVPTAEGGGEANKDHEAKRNSVPGADVDKLPHVFFWQYGDTLTHGVIMLTDPVSTLTEEASLAALSPSLLQKNKGFGSSALRPTGLPPPPNARLPLNLWQSLLPIGILSVVDLGRLLREFSALLQPQKEGATQRPPMFRFMPARREKNVKTENLPPRPLGVGDIERLLLIRHGVQYGCGGHFILPRLPASRLAADELILPKAVEIRTREKEPQSAESLVSFAMGYGHLLLTTTRAVYAFCHLAALPLPQESFQWKNSLVFTRGLATPTAGNTAAGACENHAMMAFCSHDSGRSQVFHLFATSYIVELRLRRRRRAQYVVQLMDAVNSINVVAVNKITSENTATEGTQGGEARTMELNSQRMTLPQYVSWRPRVSLQPVSLRTPPGPESPLSPMSFIPSRSSESSSSFFTTPYKLPLGCTNDELQFEEWIRNHKDKVVNIPNMGTLGGHVEAGLRTMLHYDTDFLYGMALRIAACSSLERERCDLLPRVRHVYAKRLFRQGRFLEAAAQHGLAMEGPPYLNTLLLEFSRVATDDMEPLILFLILRLRGYEGQKSNVETCSLELTCLTTWLVSLLLERCNQIRKERQVNGECSGLPASVTVSVANPAIVTLSVGAEKVVGENRRSLEMTAYLRRKYNLNNPRQLLDQIFVRYGAFVQWKAICAAVFGIASAELAILICERLGHHGEVLSRLFMQQERQLDGLVCLERNGTGVCASALTKTTTSVTTLLKEDQLNQLNQSLKTYWLKYASILMRFCPCRFVRRGLIPFGSDLGLNPMQLFPALLLYDPRRNERTFEVDGAIEVVLQRHMIEESLLEEERARATYHAAQLYLEHVIYTEGYTNECLLNLLMYFTARDGDDAALTRFFTELCANHMSHRLEVSYAYRVCLRFGRHVGCAWTCFITGRYEEAIQLAMKIRNEELAIHFIRSIRGNNEKEIRHMLWNRLATTTAKNGGGGSRRALQLIAESEGDLNVSDVLPHLSGDVMMQEFREELLASVSIFSNTLVSIKQAIEVSLKDVEAIKRDMENIQRRPLKLPSTQRCAVCGKAALTRPFVAFNGCRHVYHKRCFDACRAKMEEQLRSLKDLSTSLPVHTGEEIECMPLEDVELECVFCSRRYLRLFLTVPLSNNITSSLLRLP